MSKSPDRAKRVLVVEDEKPMAYALQLKLTRSGFKTAVVFGGEEALELLGRENFDLIVLDLVMPNVDGFAVLEELRRRKIMTPVIVISNLGQEEDIKRAKALGVRDYFVKSDTSIVTLVERAGKILGE